MKSLFPVLRRFGGRFRDAVCHDVAAGGFSGAFVWRIECRHERFALRRWPAGTDGRRIASLHRVLRHVGACDVPVAVPLPDVDGNSVLREAEALWQIEPWLPGVADFRQTPSETKLASAMATLAAFHDAAASFTLTASDVPWFGGATFGVAPAVVERRQLLAERVIGRERNIIKQQLATSDRSEFAELARRALAVFKARGDVVYGEVCRFGEIAVPLVPCLRDVWHDHVLFTGEDVTGLIDPAACRRDAVATDLSRLIGSLVDDDAARWNAALNFYSRRRPISIDESALIPVLDRSGLLLSASTWLRRRYLLHQPCETPAVLDRLRSIVARLERL